MSAMTALGVIAKGSAEACIALTEILLPEDYNLDEADEGCTISFVVNDARPVSLNADQWYHLECGIPLIRDEDEEADHYEKRDILSISSELHLDIKILNIPLEQDYPVYFHIADGKCETHIIYVPPYDESMADMFEDCDEEWEEEDTEWLCGCEPQYCTLNELDEVWYEYFYDMFAENGMEECLNEMCVPFDPNMIAKANPSV